MRLYSQSSFFILLLVVIFETTQLVGGFHPLVHFGGRWDASVDDDFNLQGLDHIGNGKKSVQAQFVGNMEHQVKHQESNNEFAGRGHEYHDREFQHKHRRHRHDDH